MKSWGWRSIAASVAGAAIGAVLGWRVSANAMDSMAKTAYLDFKLAATQRIALLSDALTVPEDLLDTLFRFFENTEKVGSSDFSGFVAPWEREEQELGFAAIRADGRVGLGKIETDLEPNLVRLIEECDAGDGEAAELLSAGPTRGRRILIVRTLKKRNEYRYIAVAADLTGRIANALHTSENQGIRTGVSAVKANEESVVYSDLHQNATEDVLQRRRRRQAAFEELEWRSAAGIDFKIVIEADPNYLLRRRNYLGYFFTPGASLLFALLAFTLEKLVARGDRAERLRKMAFEDLDHFFSLDLDLFCITDSDDRFIRLNPAWKRIFGYAPKDLIGTSFLDLIHPDDRAVALQAASRSGKSTSIHGFTTRAKHRNGSWLRVEWKSAPLGGHIYTAARDVTEREEYEAKLRKSVAEKETLLREVHHRVKNNMQIISSLLNLQGRDIDDPLLNEAVERAQGRIRTMAMVHDALYHSADFTDIDFDDYAQSLAAYCVSGMDRSAFAVRVAPSGIKLSLDLAIPCGLILNELATNSALYAFAAAGTTHLTIGLAETDNLLTLTVADDGQGLGPDFAVDKDAKLGLSLVASLASQIGGKMEIEGDHGTRVRIAFKPLPGSYVSRRAPAAAL